MLSTIASAHATFFLQQTQHMLVHEIIGVDLVLIFWRRWYGGKLVNSLLVFFFWKLGRYRPLDAEFLFVA